MGTIWRVLVIIWSTYLRKFLELLGGILNMKEELGDFAKFLEVYKESLGEFGRVCKFYGRQIGIGG